MQQKETARPVSALSPDPVRGSGLQRFLRSGHLPTLFSAFLYFDFCFAIWVLNGAMAPFITETFKLSPSQTGFMISVPIFAGALMRFPLGVVSQYIGRKNAAIAEMVVIIIACAYGTFFANTFNNVINMGILLGVAGASFGVALSLGSGWFPKQHKGLAMGIAGAGNGGTAIASLFAPPLATIYGWRTVYGFAGLMMVFPLAAMIAFAKEPPDRLDAKRSIKEHLQCLWQQDGWIFNLLYVITFGGFIGFANFLPTYFYSQFHVSKIEAGQLTVLATIVGSVVRVFGGYLADRIGGITTLKIVFVATIALLSLLACQPTLMVTTIILMICFGALGAGNGALFQLVPLRWPLTTAVAGSMIGEIGALGGSLIPNIMGQAKEHTGSFSLGFVIWVIIATAVLIVLLIAQHRWTNTWVRKGGRALTDTPTL